MNKRQLIEAMADYPDEALVVVNGGGVVSEGICVGSLEGIDEHNAKVWAVSSRKDVIALEL